MKQRSIIPGILFLNLLLMLCEGCSNSKAMQPEQWQQQERYQCLPCGNACDEALYDKEGVCAHCHMQLVKKSTVTFDTVEPSNICDYIAKHPAAILLDVRTKEEYEGKANPHFGTLKNAINIPVDELESRLPGIGHLKDKEIIVFCSHSHRSPRASYLLTKNGFANVTNMAGGMSVVKDNACKK